MTDAEEPRWLDPTQMAAWVRLVQVMAWLPPKLDEALKPHGLNTFEYGILVSLSDAPDGQVAVSTLAAMARGSQSRVSHAVTRLQAKGWVCRSASATDRRLSIVTLTDAGRARLVAAAPDHVESVRQSVIDVLSDEQLLGLGSACAAIARGLQPADVPGMAPPGPWD
jgi:DNA-binding MarR family transcriptional regulator